MPMMGKLKLAITQGMPLEFPARPPDPSTPNSKEILSGVLPAAVCVHINASWGIDLTSVRQHNVRVMFKLLVEHEDLPGIEAVFRGVAVLTKLVNNFVVTVGSITCSRPLWDTMKSGVFRRKITIRLKIFAPKGGSEEGTHCRG